MRKMDGVKLHIDNIEVEGDKGMTILEAAEKAGINIPTLCHHRDFFPTGACRICVVEVEGSNRLVGSCHTPITEGMVIYTQSPKVITARKATVELLLAGHTGPCVMDARTEQCDLHQIASDLEVGSPRFKVRKPRFYLTENISPYVHRDLSKCILCYRCIRACSDLAKKDVFAIGYRGFRSKIIVDFDVPLNKEVSFVGHISPEAAEGGPLAIVENGDKISIDVIQGTIHLHVSDGEIERRLKNWKKPKPKVKKGYLSLYSRLASSADEGAIIKHRF